MRATSGFKFERYGALINLLYDNRLVLLSVEHISVSERNTIRLIRQFTILFHVSYVILKTFLSLKGRLYAAHGHCLPSSSQLGILKFHGISFYPGHHFAYLELFKNTSCLFSI